MAANQDLIFRLLVQALNTAELDKFKDKLNNIDDSSTKMSKNLARTGTLLKGLFTAYVV